MENDLTNKLYALKVDHTKEIENYKKRLQDLAEKKEAEVIWNWIFYYFRSVIVEERAAQQNYSIRTSIAGAGCHDKTRQC